MLLKFHSSPIGKNGDNPNISCRRLQSLELTSSCRLPSSMSTLKPSGYCSITVGIRILPASSKEDEVEEHAASCGGDSSRGGGGHWEENHIGQTHVSVDEVCLSHGVDVQEFVIDLFITFTFR
jgi:hypothetical protein